MFTLIDLCKLESRGGGEQSYDRIAFKDPGSEECIKSPWMILCPLQNGSCFNMKKQTPITYWMSMFYCSTIVTVNRTQLKIKCGECHFGIPIIGRTMEGHSITIYTSDPKAITFTMIHVLPNTNYISLQETWISTSESLVSWYQNY